MKDQFKEIGKMLYAESLIHGSAGNISIRQGDKIYITKTKAILSKLEEDGVIECGMEPGDNDKEASVELPVHRAIYKSCKALAIVHAHPVYAISLSMSEEKILPQDAEGKFYMKSIPVVRARDSIGSEEVIKYLSPVFAAGYVAAMIRGHGSFAIGQDIEECYRLTSTLENTCKIIVISRMLAHPQPGINQGQSQKPREIRRAIPPGIGVMDRSRYHKR
ncbi:MAG: L-fuculose-phosphate aldolase [Candidatus Saganbacteria bacterium]|uniref:L-fuculose-phosphate aldolase n=1 Tax=Candidatus Saganbacteria bacterium TaxID=2575572 RepID=A0A833L0Q6_UNCSA|nr:MAG: L-fuculose-phosphate aldolase [Candidatus Saganbacteria bacterium]